MQSNINQGFVLLVIFLIFPCYKKICYSHTADKTDNKQKLCQICTGDTINNKQPYKPEYDYTVKVLIAVQEGNNLFHDSCLFVLFFNYNAKIRIIFETEKFFWNFFQKTYAFKFHSHTPVPASGILDIRPSSMSFFICLCIDGFLFWTCPLNP